MTLSARNQLPGVVEELQLGGVMAHVVVKVGDNLVESVITRRSAEAMGLKKGDAVKVVIKSTKVMLQKDAEKHPRDKEFRKLLRKAKTEESVLLAKLGEWTLN